MGRRVAASGLGDPAETNMTSAKYFWNTFGLSEKFFCVQEFPAVHAQIASVKLNNSASNPGLILTEAVRPRLLRAGSAANPARPDRF
jgi:hypothetical protein